MRRALGAAAVLTLLLPSHAAGQTQHATPGPEPGASELARLSEELARVSEELRLVREELARLQADRDAAQRGASEPLIARLQAELQRLNDELRQLANAVEALSRAEQRQVTLTVYGSLQARAFSGETPVLDGELVEMVLSARPHARLSLLTQIEFERVAEVGGVRGGEIIVEQAWATLMLSPLAHLRAGVFLVPFGNVDVDHFPSRREVVTRPIVSYVFAPADWCDNGVGLTGRRLFGSNWLLSYEAYLGAGLGEGISGLGLRDARQPYGVDNNRDKALMGRVSLDRGQRFLLGVSGYLGKYDDAGRRALGAVALDARASLGRVRLIGEYDVFTADGGTERDARFHGYYLRGVLEFGRAWLKRSFLGRDFGDPYLALVAQYDSAVANGPVEQRFQRSHEERLSLGLNFHPATQWLLKLSYERNWTDNLALFRGDSDGWLAAVAFAF